MANLSSPDPAKTSVKVSSPLLLEKKPTGDDDEDTRRLTLAEKARVVERFDAIIAKEDEEQTMAITSAADSVRQFVRTVLGGNR